MEVGVAGADDDAVVAVEQQVAVEPVGPRLHHEVEAEQHRGMGEGGGRQAAAVGVSSSMSPCTQYTTPARPR